MIPIHNTIILALLGGIVPAVLWLFFWLREDRVHPEPRKLIFFTFVLGMAAIAVVIPLERFILEKLAGSTVLTPETLPFQLLLGIIVAWAAIEELVKLGAAYVGGLHTRSLDEPIDAPIYLITVALGFAALENALFIFDPLGSGNVLLGLLTGNIRFVGATLLHTIASGAIGVSFALSFYKTGWPRYAYRILGTVLAIALHALFNYFILQSGNSSLLLVFFFVWLAVILLILFFEKIKRITKKSIKTNYA